MPIRDLSSSTEAFIQINAEYCVIGGGMAGLFIARRLAKAGRRVVVLESGKAAFEEQSHALNAIVDVHGRYSRALDGRYRGLGGSSSRWGGRLVPIYGEDCAPRPHLNLPGWPFPHAQLERYQEEIETVFGLPHGPFGVEALHDLGLDSAFSSADPDFTGRMAKWINYRQCNLATVWRAELERLDALDIWLDATVTAFDFDTAQSRLKAVEARSFNGQTVRVTADRVVLAAGTIESTRLLLWLDAQTGGHAFAGSTALGRYFQDHLKAEVATVGRRDLTMGNRLFGYHYVDGARRSLHLDFTTRAQRETDSTSAFVYAAMDLSNSRLSRIKTVARGIQRGQVGIKDLGALVGELPLVARSAFWRLTKHQVYMPSSVRLGLQIAIEQRPDWDNQITLSAELDTMGMPKAAVHWRPRAADEQTFRSVAERLRSYWTRSHFDDDYPLDWLVDETSPMGFTALAEAYAHPSGSARMGTNPKDSVVGPDLVCHGVGNLSVASAAVFPSAGSANPTLTILQLALRHADHLLEATHGCKVSVQTSIYASSNSLAAESTPLSASATQATSASVI